MVSGDIDPAGRALGGPRAAQADRGRIWRTGDIAPAGRYQCTTCGTRFTLPEDGPLPRCAYCHAGEFRRVHE